MARIVPLILSVVIRPCANQLAERGAFLNQFVGHQILNLTPKLSMLTRPYQAGGNYLKKTESHLAFALSLSL